MSKRVRVNRMLNPTLEDKLWKDIPEYNGKYQISTYGDVKSFKRYKSGKIMKVSYSKSFGYKWVSLRKDNKYKTFPIHRLIAMTFVENPDNKPYVNHINGIKTDNRISNLEWCTQQENCQHAWETGLCTPHGPRGINSHFSKLTEKDVIEIRRLYATGKYNQTQLAEKYNINHSNIHNIVKHKTWKCVKGGIK